MAILAASVCTREGKTLLSRLFKQLDAESVQELLSNFSKLAGGASQHTVVEDDKARYVYEPLEELYVVVITDLQSNILQDLQTLRLISQIVANYAPACDERTISEHAFDLISGFDEVVMLGYAESLTLSQVETFLEMESHEEKIQEIIERNKELEAAEERKKKARQLDAQRRAQRQPAPYIDQPGSMRGIGSGGGFGSIGHGGQGSYSEIPGGSGIGGYGGQDSYDVMGNAAGLNSSAVPVSMYDTDEVQHSKYNERKGHLRGKGLQLGKKKAGNSESDVPLLAQLDRPERKRTESLVSQPLQSPAAGARPHAPGKNAAIAATHGTSISITDSLVVDATKDGSVRSARVSGTLHLFAADPEHKHLRIKTQTGGPPTAYKTNPKMDRALFTKERVLGLGRATEGFPSSNVLLVKWTVDKIDVPVLFNVWISESNDPGFMSVTVEYELSESFTGTLRDTVVRIPLPTDNTHVTDPMSDYEMAENELIWRIASASHADGSGSGVFEFTAEADSEEDLVPIKVNFTCNDAPKPLGDIVVTGVADADTDAPVEFSQASTIVVDSYVIR